MIKNIFLQPLLFFCSSFLLCRSSKSNTQSKSRAAKSDVKFLEDISINTAPVAAVASDPKADLSKSIFTNKNISQTASSNNLLIENANSLQFKYALMMDIEIEQISNLELYKAIDGWFGTKYRYGGASKSGIDCSALMQTLYSSVYQLTLPRTAKDQFNYCSKISRTEIREGDLIFFNTVGGVSHVGMYLQNNKFLHASKGGVTISDMYEEYWMKKFVGVGRIETSQQMTASISRL